LLFLTKPTSISKPVLPMISDETVLCPVSLASKPGI
jgi:hypothetical protein